MQALAGLFVCMCWLLILLPLLVHNGPFAEGIHLSVEFVKAKVMNLPFTYNGADYAGNALAGIKHLSFGISGIIFILGIIPAFFVKERYYEHHLSQKQKKVGLVTSFRETLSNKPFMILCGFTVFFLLGTSIWDSYGRYVGSYYVLGGDWGRSAVFGVYGTVIYTVMSLLFIPFFKWLSEHIGKPRCLMIATIIVLFSAATTWFTFTPAHPYVMLLNTFLIGAGYAGLWLMIPSMQADVIDLDELKTGERREGSYSAVFSWVLKISFCVGYLISGPLLELTGFDAAREGAQPDSVYLKMRLGYIILPVVSLILAVIFLKAFKLTPQKAAEIRSELEARRGKV
jgi:GPH family glycoside/pentoside/hexuronide:cation symporter